jgi:hypothetical protein
MPRQQQQLRLAAVPTSSSQRQLSIHLGTVQSSRELHSIITSSTLKPASTHCSSSSRSTSISKKLLQLQRLLHYRSAGYAVPAVVAAIQSLPATAALAQAHLEQTLAC